VLDKEEEQTTSEDGRYALGAREHDPELKPEQAHPQGEFQGRAGGQLADDDEGHQDKVNRPKPTHGFGFTFQRRISNDRRAQ
jgi:hypothetical protein